MVRHLAIVIFATLVSSVALAGPVGALRAYYDAAPNCITVMEGPSDAGIAVGPRIANALARQLSGRVDRVIYPLERRRLVRAMAVDLDHPGDARHFAATTRCRVFLRWQVLGAGHDNALVWSQKYISIGAEIFRARDGALLWQSHAEASRSSGDVPLSLYSLPLALVRTAAFQGDDDAVASMLDDLARRILASLPDLR